MTFEEIIISIDRALTGRSEANCQKNLASQPQFRTASGWLMASRLYKLCGTHAGLRWSEHSLDIVILYGSDAQNRRFRDNHHLIKQLRDSILQERAR